MSVCLFFSSSVLRSFGPSGMHFSKIAKTGKTQENSSQFSTFRNYWPDSLRFQFPPIYMFPLHHALRLSSAQTPSSQGFFFPIWSISWYQWRRDVMTPGRHQCQFGSHWWRRVDIDVNSHQWGWVNIWATQMSTRRHWCEFTDVNPTSLMWTKLTLMTSQRHDVPASLISRDWSKSHKTTWLQVSVDPRLSFHKSYLFFSFL